MADLLKFFRSKAGDFKARLRDVRAELERKRQRREFLRTSSLPASENADKLIAVLERRGAQFAEDMDRRTAHVKDDPFVAHDSPGMAGSNILFRNLAVNSHELEGLLMEFFPEQMRAAINRRCAAVKCDVGPGAVDRVREMDEIDAEVAALEKEEKAMLAEFEEIRKETEA